MEEAVEKYLRQLGPYERVKAAQLASQLRR